MKRSFDKPKKLWELDKQEKTVIILDALMKAGYSNSDASHILNVSRQYTFKLNKKMAKGTLNPLVNKAKKAVKTILAGKLVGDMKSVSGSEILAAAKMVLDRSDPVKVVSENTNISMRIDITPDKRERYLALLGIQGGISGVLPDPGIKQIEHKHEIQVHEDTKESKVENKSIEVEAVPVIPQE